MVGVLLVRLVVVRIVMVGRLVVRIIVVGSVVVGSLVVGRVLVRGILVGLELVRTRLELGPRPPSHRSPASQRHVDARAADSAATAWQQGWHDEFRSA